MILLDATTKSLEVLLAAAVTTSQLPYTAHYIDVDTSTFALTTSAESDGTTNDTTAVTAIAAPSSGRARQVKFLTIYNADTVAATVTVRINNNGTTRILAKVTLQPGETLQYE